MLRPLPALLALVLLAPQQPEPAPDKLIPTPGVADPKLPAPPAGKKWVVSEGYDPISGDRLYVKSQVGVAMASVDATTFAAGIRAVVSSDTATIRRMVDDKKTAPLTNGTAIRVLKTEDFKADSNSYCPACSAMILDGPYANRTVWVLTEDVAKMTLVDLNTAKIDDVKRAESLLKAAQNLEKAGKTKGAIETYSRIVREFSATPSAKPASERLKAIIPK